MEVSFTYPRTTPKSQFYRCSGYESLILSKLAKTPMHTQVMGNDRLVLLHDTGAPGKYISWGASITTKIDVDPVVVAGPRSCEALGISPTNRYCDARILYAWACNVRRASPQRNVLAVIDAMDYTLDRFEEELTKSGITLIHDNCPIPILLEHIATSRLVVTSSPTAFIYAESLGVPVHPFFQNSPLQVFRDRLEDYYLGTSRDIEKLEFLDFTERIRIDHLPNAEKPMFDIKTMTNNIPFEYNVEMKKDLETFFNS